MATDETRVFRARTAQFERAVKATVWADPLTAELARGLGRVMDGAIRTDQPKLFFEASDRLARLPRGGSGERDQVGAAGGGVAGFVGAGPEVGDAAES